MKIFLIIGVSLMMLSCLEQGECSDVSSNLLKVGFYNYSDRKQRTLELDSITIQGANLTFYKDESEREIELPLNPEWQSISYKIYFGGTVTELHVEYQKKVFALAPDCVAISLYTITDTAGTAKEIFFTQREITTNTDENLKLYF